MLGQKLQLKNNKEYNMPEDKVQQQATPQPQQGGEGVGMSRTFPENSSLEVLNNRRIDQIVAKRESDRMKEAQAIKFAQEDGVTAGRAEGVDTGRKEGYDLGTSHGLEYGYKKGINSSDSGLGKSLGLQSKEPDSVVSSEDAIAQQSVV